MIVLIAASHGTVRVDRPTANETTLIDVAAGDVISVDQEEGTLHHNHTPVGPFDRTTDKVSFTGSAR